MIYAYIRVSTDKQNPENQKFEIYNYTDNRNISVDKWIIETESGRKSYKKRKLGDIISFMDNGDILITTEISRLGRNLTEIMTILNELIEKDCKVYTVKERYELVNDINSKVLAFAFSLSDEIERQLISQRTKQALDRKKSEGKKLGRPFGSLSKNTKLTGKDEIIKEYLRKKVSKSAIARILNVSRKTLHNYIESRKLAVV